MKNLKIENLSKSYSDRKLLDSISFSISEGEKIGLIGINGTGKSTLLKILAGIETPSTGNIDHPKDYRIEYLSQNPILDAQLTVLEQVFYGESPLMKLFREYETAIHFLQNEPNNERKQQELYSLHNRMDAMNAWEVNSLAKTILNQLGLKDFSKKISELSGGQKKRVAIASALIQPADLLILDEPTNHIDNETIDWLEDYLARYNNSILLVTHDRYFLNRVTNKIIELDLGNIYNYEGNYEYFLEKKAEREDRALATESKQNNILRRELAWLKKGAKARTTKQKARIERVGNLQADKSDNINEKIDISLGNRRLGKKVIIIDKVNKSFDKQFLIRNFNYIINPGDKIGIIGPNGSGKTTFLNLISKKIQPDSGIIEIGETVKLAYYTQENIEMDDEMRVIDYIKEEAEYIISGDGTTLSAAQMLEKFLFSPSIQWSMIGKLSGGERRRLYLLKVLMTEPNLLLLDEPTNDLDIQTLSILEEYIENFKGVVITVSHDRYFLDRTVDYLLTFENSGNITRFNGNYSEYLQLQIFEKEKVNKQEQKFNEDLIKKATPPQKLSYKEQREWDGLEDRINSLEKRINQIQEEIVKAGSDYKKIESLYIEDKEFNLELEKLVERWTELSELIEQIQITKGS